MNINKFNSHDLSFIIFNKFESYFDATPQSNKKIRLGIEVLLINISKLILMIFLAILLNIFVESMIAGACIGYLRITLGGKHAGSSFKCTIYSLLVLFSCVYLSKFVQATNLVLILAYPILMYLIYKYAPADTIKNPIKSDDRRKKLKKASIKKSLFIMILSLLIPIIELKTMMFYSVISVVIFILPININFFKRSDNNGIITKKVS